MIYCSIFVAAVAVFVVLLKELDQRFTKAVILEDYKRKLKII